MREGLNRCGWYPHSEEELAVDWAMSGEDANGEPARNESLVSFDPDASYEWWGPDDRFVIDQHPRGFARLIDGMVRDSVPSGDRRVLFEAEVTKIKYGCRGVGVTTKDGRMFTAAHQVISTLPLGVMRHHHAQLFDPPLPKEQAALLSPEGRFVMGNLTHVVVQFPRVWWDDKLPKWLASNRGSNETAAGGPDGGGRNAAGEFAVWHNLNHPNYLPGSQTLLTFLGDPQSSVYEAMPDEEVKAALIRRLRLQHPRAEIPSPTAFFISRHGFDANSFGAYSISLAGWDSALHHTLSRPLKSCNQTRIRFAGEAMCSNLNGYTHGAYQSGKENAARYLHEQAKGPDPAQDDALSLCDR
jgi:monoamine oxidase